MNIVVDTNVIAYYWLPGEHTDSAVALRRRTGDWFAPRLWRSEFRNVLAGYVRRGSITLDGAKATIRGAEAELADFECEVDSVQVMDLVAQSVCSAYDCEFVALARSMDIALVTEDARILREFPDSAIRMSAAAAQRL